MDKPLELLDIVALAVDLPDEGLVRGHVGTVVECYSDNHFEVEFSDGQGKSYALLPLPENQLILLRHAPVRTG